MLVAGLRLYWLENGAYPETLDQLIPECLDFLPQDPLSDKPWIYTKEEGEITITSHGDECDWLTFTFPDETGVEQSSGDGNNHSISTERLRSIQTWADEEIEQWEGESGAKFPSDLKPIH